MKDGGSIKKIESMLRKAVALAKCRKCGCMKEALENVHHRLSNQQEESCLSTLESVQNWLRQMGPIEYSCLGCNYCFAAETINILNQAFADVDETKTELCQCESEKQDWPVAPGEYFAFCQNDVCPAAVTTLASPQLAASIAQDRPKGLCIVGKTETENIGIEKIIKNVITNTAIRFLIVAGRDPQGHHSGKTLLALSEKGIDKDMKVIGSPAKFPVLRNVAFREVESFRQQIEIFDMIGCDDAETIIGKINELSEKTSSPCKRKKTSTPMFKPPACAAQKTIARQSGRIKMDKAGYFVIIPSREKKIIVVEHYSYDNKLLHTIEGKQDSAIYLTIIKNGWVTELNHAAYLGKELAKARLSLTYGFDYVQDGAGGKAEDDTQ